MSICMKKNYYFPIKLLKSGFVANVKYGEEPGFGMLHHKYSSYLFPNSKTRFYTLGINMNFGCQESHERWYKVVRDFKKFL